MGRTSNRKLQEMRIRKVPVELKRDIAVYQKEMCVSNDRSVTLDEACIDLLKRALESMKNSEQ
jgi:hypothetical protein